MKRILVVLAVLMLLLGCSLDYKYEVTSDTSWSGYFDDSTIEGTGNKTIDAPDDGYIGAVVQKQTEAGFLKVKIVEHSKGLFSGKSTIDSASTTAAFGVVSVSH